MIYRSNLTSPDLAPHFELKTPAIQIQGHDAPSDPDFEPGCTFWTHDEAAILFNVAKQVGGCWLDLGARFGWTTAHLVEAECYVTAVDLGLSMQGFSARFESNLENHWHEISEVFGKTSQDVLAAFHLNHSVLGDPDLFDGFVIDADHDEPQPLLDAQGCHRIANPDAVILMHDFWGRPIQDGVRWLIDQGWRCRIYNTPNGVALLWRGFEHFGILAPEHIPDPAIDWGEIRSRVSDFPWAKTE